jgi:N-acetylglucosaminyl-diphospho-decaprenol L-rhamnosyltransferase
MSAPLTSIIVVAADSGRAMADAVRRALASTADVELIVSDNASGDGSVAALVAEFGADPRFHVVYNGRNLGFGAGVNRAAAQARGDYLLILNPDCWLEPDTLPRLLARAAAVDRLGLLGARIRHPDGSDEPASIRRDPTLRRSLLTLSGIARFGAQRPALRGVDLHLDDTARGEDRAAEIVSGALMLVPRAAFDAVDGFDEGYFLHCEDMDLCRRLRDAGYTVFYAGSVSVVHGKGGSSRHRPVFVAWHKHRSKWRWFRRFDPAAANPLLRALVFCGLWARFGLLLPLLLWRKWRRAG